MSIVIHCVDPDYRFMEALLGAWTLEYRDPARGLWHEIAHRPSLTDIEAAYDRLSDGETVPYEDES